MNSLRFVLTYGAQKCTYYMYSEWYFAMFGGGVDFHRK